jgi:hypothetical protein
MMTFENIFISMILATAMVASAFLIHRQRPAGDTA